MALSFPLALVLALGGPQAQQSSGAPDERPPGLVPEGGGLQPFDGGVEALDARPLNADTLADRLSEPDLDRREEHVDRIVERAQTEPAVRRALEELVDQDADPELAWSARMALRLVEARGGSARAPRGLRQWPGARGTDPFEALDELFGTLRPFGGVDPFESWPGGGWPGLAPDAEARGLRAELQKTPDGTRLRLEQTDASGESSVREYEGESLEAILEDHPELGQELEAAGIRLRGGGAFGGLAPFGGRIGGDPFAGTPFEELRSLDELRPRTPLPDGGRREGGVRTDVLGVRVAPVPTDQAARLGLEPGVGLRVDSTVPGTIAAALGVEAGAVLVALDGRTLKGVDDVAAALDAREAGATVRLVWLGPAGDRHERSWTPPTGASDEEGR